MNKKTGLTSLLLAVCLLMSSCMKADDNSNNGITVVSNLDDNTVLVGNIDCTFPLVTENTTLNFLMSGYGDVQADDIFVFKKYEEMTGVDISWTTVKSSERSESVYNSLINKRKLDLIMRCVISSNDLIQYGKAGYIIDLSKDGLLEKNAPNCWAYLQSHTDALASITSPDGSIYSLPQINSGAEVRVSKKIFINKKWLENVNMDIPKTTEEFYLLLKAFKEQDANGNGDVDDEIPFSLWDWVSLRDSMWGAFGLGNRGSHNRVVDCDERTGKARLITAAPEYRSYLEYLNRLYTEGLLDNHIFTITMDQWQNNVVNDRVGVFAGTNLALLPGNSVDNWVAIEEALEGPDGDKLWTAIRANFHSEGNAVIPSTCSNPELVLRWLDYFWTDEGTLFYHMGIEGETFVVNDDGSYDYMPYIYDEIQRGVKSFDDIVATYSPYPGGGNPTVELAPYFMGGEMADIPATAAKKLFEYGPDEYWPNFTFTAEENEQLNAYKSDIDKFCETARVDFVTGTKPFSQWDDYLAQLKNLGQDEMVAIYQEAIDRYNTLKGSH